MRGGITEPQWVGISNTQEEKCHSPVLWSGRATEVSLGVGTVPGNDSRGRAWWGCGGEKAGGRSVQAEGVALFRFRMYRRLNLLRDSRPHS